MWKYNNKNFKDPGEYYGFVYRITRKFDGKFYIGSKSFTSFRTKKLSKKRANEIYSGKGRKKTKEKVVSQSNWEVYTGSSKTLNDDILEMSEKSFKFEILELCSNKSSLIYKEGEYQYKNNCLLSDNCYNEWIYVKVHKSGL